MKLLTIKVDEYQNLLFLDEYKDKFVIILHQEVDDLTIAITDNHPIVYAPLQKRKFISGHARKTLAGTSSWFLHCKMSRK